MACSGPRASGRVGIGKETENPGRIVVSADFPPRTKPCMGDRSAPFLRAYSFACTPAHTANAVLLIWFRLSSIDSTRQPKPEDSLFIRSSILDHLDASSNHVGVEWKVKSAHSSSRFPQNPRQATASAQTAAALSGT